MYKLIAMGLAYADDTPKEEMKIQRDSMTESKYRKMTPEENKKRFDDMVKGKDDKFCMRAKLNMQDKVGCLRDPVFYRSKKDPHHRTGDKYKAYPTYDFTIPIVDSIEGVTHALRTIEYGDRAALYAWVQDTLKLRKVEMYEFSKMNFVNTVLSKRKLKWFVEQKKVTGWNDPRFPTVQGMIRRGLTIQTLKDFMLDQGPSKNTNLQEWDKIWAKNKDNIDMIAPRYTAINKSTACRLTIDNGPADNDADVHPFHPKNPDLGTKVVIRSKELYIEKEDAEDVVEGEKITLMKWGNCHISKKEIRDGTIYLTGTIDVEDKVFKWNGKNTKKLTWLPTDPSTLFMVDVVEMDHLITKPKIDEEDKLEDLVNPNSKVTYQVYSEGCIKNIQHGTWFQFERRGYFYVDKIALKDCNMTVHYVPDGKSSNQSKIGSAIDAKKTAKGMGGNENEPIKKKQEAKEGSKKAL